MMIEARTAVRIGAAVEKEIEVETQEIQVGSVQGMGRRIDGKA